MPDVRLWLGDKLRQYASQHGRSGEQLVADCPWPDCGAAARLYVNASDGRWLCYHCGRKGGLAKLVAYLQGRTVAEVEGEIGSPPPVSASALRARLEAAVAPRDLYRPPPPCPLPGGFRAIGPGVPLPAYLAARQVGYKLARRYGLGVCGAGRYAGRVALPAYQHGRVVWWQARATVPGVEPRYLSPQAPREGVLWGYDQVAGEPEVVLVEGPFDVLRCAVAGVPAVALCGKPIAAAQLSALRRACVRRVVVMLDPDARRDAACMVARLAGEGVDVALARLDRADPGDSTPGEIRQAVAEAGAPLDRERMGRRWMGTKS